MTPIQREHLELIRQTYGALRPEDVLNDARNPNSPLHDCFTWDDSIAAEAYRLIQAKTVIKVAVRYLPGPDQRPQRVRFTTLDLQSARSERSDDQAADELFRMNLREAEIAVQIFSLSQEREYLIQTMLEVTADKSDFATERYAIDLFVRGVPMEDLIEVVNFSVEGASFTESDILGWISRYGGYRPRRWSAKLAKEQWDADEGANFGAVFGVLPYQPPSRLSVTAHHNGTPVSIAACSIQKESR